MKVIQLIETERLKSLEIFRAVLSHAGKSGINYGEMERRQRVFNILDDAKAPVMMMEDADHGYLVSLIKEFPFGTFHPELKQILDAVVQAKAADRGTA